MSETNPPAEKPADDQPKGACCCAAGGASSDDGRRGFLGAIVALGAGVAALFVPAVSGLIAFLNPLRQKGEAGKPVRLTSLEALPADGTPQLFPVVTDKTDAWTKASNQVVGSVFLKRTEDEKQPVVAYQVVCPHAGCTIVFEKNDEGGRFTCPCHEAYFDLDGGRIGESRSPRDMDTLDVEVKDGSVLVNFVNYRVGTSEKIPEA
jgi:Rieske Fe-S protein